jgi:plasmid stability protein
VVARNITFSLPAELLRQAKIYAAEHDTTVNALVRELLENKVNAEARAQAAAKRMLEIAEQGPHSAVDPGSIRREELHERG